MIISHDLVSVMSKILSLLLILFLLTSCSLGGTDTSPLDEIAGKSLPDTIYIKYKFKKEKYILVPWDYTTEIKCGWVYDQWMNQFDGMNVCNRICMEREKNDHRVWLFETFERCMYHD